MLCTLSRKDHLDVDLSDVLSISTKIKEMQEASAALRARFMSTVHKLM